MAERKGFTRTGPEATTNLLEKGEGFETKHTSGLNADGDKVVCGQQVCILGLCCCSVSKPGSLEAKAMWLWDGARLLGHVASHTIT